MNKYFIFIMVFTVMCFNIATATAEDFVNRILHVNLSNNPTSIEDEVRNNPEITMVLDSIATYYGCTACVSSALKITEGLSKKQDDTIRGHVVIPKGYTYCATYRLEPQSQSDHANLHIFLSPKEKHTRKVHWTAFASKRQVGGGRTWIRKAFNLVFVKNDKVNEMIGEKKCHKIEWGNAGTDHKKYGKYYSIYDVSGKRIVKNNNTRSTK